jgi:phosphoglycolate phosphatase
MRPRPCRLFLFDLDGTLIDSKADISKSVNLALDRLRLAPVATARIAAFVGDGVQKLIQRTLRQSMGIDANNDLVAYAIRIYLEEYEQHLMDNTSLYPGVREMLNALVWADCAVITNKPEKFSRRILDALGVEDRFLSILGGDSMEERKPNPAPLLRIINQCRVLPAETVMVGDSHIDIRAGKAAGTITCGILGGFGTKEELETAECDLIIEGASELTRYFCPPLHQHSSHLR